MAPGPVLEQWASILLVKQDRDLDLDWKPQAQGGRGTGGTEEACQDCQVNTALYFRMWC